MAKILVVDDEPDLEVLIKQRFRKQIRDRQYEFVFAVNGTDALSKIRESEDLDIVLSDINMPEMDGLTLLDKLGQANYTKILVIDAGKGAAIRIYPNPAKDQLTVVIAGREAQNYELVMYSVSGQTIYQRTMQHVIQETIKVNRTATMKPGIYMLKVANQTTGDISTYKILFE